MLWKFNNLFFNIKDYINGYKETHAGQGGLIEASLYRLNSSYSSYRMVLIYLNQNENAIDFLLENTEYITCAIFSNKGFIPYIKNAWRNRNTIFGGIFKTNYLNDLFFQKKYNNYTEYCLSMMFINSGLYIDDILKIVDDIPITDIYDLWYEQNIRNRQAYSISITTKYGYPSIYTSWECDEYLFIKDNPHIYRYIKNKIFQINTTQPELSEEEKCMKILKYKIFLDNYGLIWINPDYYLIYVYVHNEICKYAGNLAVMNILADMNINMGKMRIYSECELDINISVEELDADILLCLCRIVSHSGKINQEFIIIYILSHLNDIFEYCSYVMYFSNIVHFFFSLDINIVKYPDIVAKYENNPNFIDGMCSNNYFFDYLCSVSVEKRNKILASLTKKGWEKIFELNRRAIDIMLLCPTIWEYSQKDSIIDSIENIQKWNILMPSVKKYAPICVFNGKKCVISSPHFFKNSGWFVPDIKKMVKYKQVFFEELMQKTWSPERVQKLIDFGIDPDDM